MAYELRDMSGTLFPNDKRTNDRQPHWRGKVMVHGQPLQVSGWTKQTKAGDEFLSLAFSTPTENADKDVPF